MTHLRADLDFDAFARFVSDGLAYVGVEGLVSAWSSAAAAITGIQGADAVGRSLEELFARVDPGLGFAALPEPLQLWTNDEHRRLIRATVLSVDEGWLISFGPQQRFAAIDQLKNEIVAAVSHELKTPIATIKAYATTMRMSPETLAREGGDYLTTIEEQADRLANAIEDMLRVGRVDPAHLLESRRNVTLDAVLDEVAVRLGPTAAARIERRGTDVALDCDTGLLADAIARVIENALKFSPDSAPVTVEASRGSDGVRIDVRDRGIGIGAEHIPYIFERFYRVEHNLTASTAGTGLGLAIVRDIVHAHGGRISVNSEPRDGTTVSMLLPDRSAVRADV
jgi:two-component system, OmpR family, phosphate regulon sensor histidine kinase PhoR